MKRTRTCQEHTVKNVVMTCIFEFRYTLSDEIFFTNSKPQKNLIIIIIIIIIITFILIQEKGFTESLLN